MAAKHVSFTVPPIGCGHTHTRSRVSRETSTPTRLTRDQGVIEILVINLPIAPLEQPPTTNGTCSSSAQLGVPSGLPVLEQNSFMLVTFWLPKMSVGQRPSLSNL